MKANQSQKKRPRKLLKPKNTNKKLMTKESVLKKVNMSEYFYWVQPETMKILGTSWYKG